MGMSISYLKGTQARCCMLPEIADSALEELAKTFEKDIDYLLQIISLAFMDAFMRFAYESGVVCEIFCKRCGFQGWTTVPCLYERCLEEACGGRLLIRELMVPNNLPDFFTRRT